MINFAVKLAVTVAMEAAQMALQASKRTVGPRLDELKVTVADYGTPIPRFLGGRRFSCPIFHAEDLRETEQSTKIKGGGKQTTYHYLGTFACAIADNAIDRVLKVWFDGKLVYDTTAAGPSSLVAALGDFVNGTPSSDIANYMRVYTGTETQLPDPRYASWCEAKYGPNSAPAYRGVSYLFFEDLPLDNFGNRIPQVEVLAVSAPVAAYPFSQVNTVAPGNTFYEWAISPSGNWMIRWSPGVVEFWDLPTRTLINTVSFDAGLTGSYQNMAVDDSGTAYNFASRITPAHMFLTAVSSTGSVAASDVSSTITAYAGPTRVLATSSGDKVLTAMPDGTYCNGATQVPFSAGDIFRDACIDDLGAIWVVSHPNATSSQFSIWTGGTRHDFTGSASRSALTDARICYSSTYGSFCVIFNGYLYIIDKATWTITHTVAHATTPIDFPVNRPGATSFWELWSEYSLKDGALLRTGTAITWPATESGGGGSTIYDPVSNALVSRWNNTPQHVTWRYLDRATNGGTTLGAIVSSMCDAAGLTSRDTSALTQSVLGYSWTRGDVKSQMEPVLDIHDVDARPHDFSLQFLPRGSAPSGTILTQDMVKNGDARYKSTTKQDTDLPKILRVNFADNDFDQQTNNVLSPLPADSVDSQRDDVIDLTTYADTPAGAQQKSDRYLRRQWNSKQSIEAALTAQYQTMEPGDVTTISLDGISQNVKLDKQAFAAGRMDCTFVRDETSFAAINSATTGPSMAARVIDTIYVSPPIVGFVVDAPYRQDSDADVRPIIYAGAGTYPTFTFPGSVIYQQSSGAYDVLFAAITSGATWGYCSVLGSANANLWDRGNTLTVTLEAGLLTSVTEADINADPTLNLMLVGQPGAWEYVNFTTATLVSGNTYALSGFKRGRRGTEWAVGLHKAGDVIVLASALAVEEMGSDDVGNSLSFKAQSVGRSIDSAAPINLTPFTGASLKPYAPANVKWFYDGTNLIGTIARRTRVGGVWNGSTIPLAEASEAYEVDIYNGSTFKRTIALSGTNVFTYTAAMAAADGITLPTPPPIKAHQLSAIVGRGFALAA